MTRFVLSGGDHLVHGRVAVGGIERVAGVALTAGWGTHAWRHDDGNEDVVGLEIRADGVRVVVCDGHYGFSTASAAFHVAMNDGRVDAGLVRDADEAAIRAKAQRDQPTSGTTFIVADVTGTVLRWVSVGDSSLYVFRDGRLERRNVLRGNRFVGYTGPGREPAESAMDDGADDLRPGDFVVVASDGFVDYADAAAAAALLAQSPDPVAAAAALVRLTESTEPGDNVAVAVVRV